MRYRMLRGVLVGVVMLGVGGRFSSGERTEEAGLGENGGNPAQQVSLSQVPEPARAAIERLTATGEIKKIEQAREDGRSVYNVEATVQARDMEYDVAADGMVLTTEQSVPYASLPPGGPQCRPEVLRLRCRLESLGGTRGRQDLLRGRRPQRQGSEALRHRPDRRRRVVIPSAAGCLFVFACAFFREVDSMGVG